ncbi:metallophosphoesterase [Pseudomonas sp. Irchel s3b2]|uniref:metallophosphoesterase n=1 Tax=Pseudomonas sp. Irchel s3b2 TaxID=2009073 RepID=UPI00114091A3|nr:metallophosphoesterase [Pseudomonas sp. Irchel s3b2]
MKVYVLSDLHLEFSEFVPPPTGADLVTLAGDIDPKCRAVEWANLAFERKVIYACGNHEFHEQQHDQSQKLDSDMPRSSSWEWRRHRRLAPRFNL